MSERPPTLNLKKATDLSHMEMLEGNQRFAQRMMKEDPEFFARQARSQKPGALWIGCSDSRVASDVITDQDPGHTFVHRNIANVVVHTDMNMLSALDYAVNVLQIHHVIVCGHYGCGGVRAAMSDQEHGLIDNWLRHIKDVYRIHADELSQIEDEDERANRLVELNVREQVYNVCKTNIVQRSWRKHQRPFVHGWVYDLGSGLIKDLEVNISGRQDLFEIYRLDVDKLLNKPGS